MAEKKKGEWFHWLLVVLGVLVLLVGPGMPLNAVTGNHIYEHYVLGLVLVALGLWKWQSKGMAK